MRVAVLALLLVLGAPTASSALTFSFEYVGGAHVDNALILVEGVCEDYRPFSPTELPLYPGGVCGVPVGGHVRVDVYEDSLLITGFHWVLHDRAGVRCAEGWALFTAEMDASGPCDRLDVFLAAGAVHGFIDVRTDRWTF